MPPTLTIPPTGFTPPVPTPEGPDEDDGDDNEVPPETEPPTEPPVDVPEPGTLAILIIGAGFTWFALRRRKTT